MDYRVPVPLTGRGASEGAGSASSSRRRPHTSASEPGAGPGVAAARQPSRSRLRHGPPTYLYTRLQPRHGPPTAASRVTSRAYHARAPRDVRVARFLPTLRKSRARRTPVVAILRAPRRRRILAGIVRWCQLELATWTSCDGVSSNSPRGQACAARCRSVSRTSGAPDRTVIMW